MTRPDRVVVVGAGISGLVAARRLVAAGCDVRLVDKGPSVGGRLATRRIEGATLDHGAQFFTVRTLEFEETVDGWLDAGIARVWSHGFTDDDGHPRYVGTAGMNSLAKNLAVGLQVETSTMAFTVRRTPESAVAPWEVAIDDGSSRPADAVILTCPIPQSLALLVDSGIELDEVFRVDYDRTLALLARLDAPPAIPAPGGVQQPDDVFSFIGDNRAKGISAEPAVTFHANPQWSEEHWDEPSDDTVEKLRAAASDWLGEANVVSTQLKRWRFATPKSVSSDPCWIGGGGAIIVAGDAFAGPRVEGAHNSGLAAARALLD